MAGYLVSDNRKVTTHRFMEMKQKGEKISMLTSYDYTMAGIVDKAGIDAILIGDSASNVMAGNQPRYQGFAGHYQVLSRYNTPVDRACPLVGMAWPHAWAKKCKRPKSRKRLII